MSSRPVVSWAGPALAAEIALRLASEEAEVHKLGARERAIEAFRQAEDHCRVARYFLEDERIVEMAVHAKRGCAVLENPLRKECIACGKPVSAQSAFSIGDKIYHSDCLPPHGINVTIYDQDG